MVVILLLGVTYRYETKGLRLVDPQRSLSGSYRCEADNEVNQPISASANIIIEGNEDR